MIQSKNENDMLKAGTGFMLSLADSIHHLYGQGYVENLIPRFDHFECRSGTIKLKPDDIVIDRLVRFENTSDPDDQSILYAVSAPQLGLKGLYVEGYGPAQDELSHEMIERLKEHPH